MAEKRGLDKPSGTASIASATPSSTWEEYFRIPSMKRRAFSVLRSGDTIKSSRGLGPSSHRLLAALRARSKDVLGSTLSETHGLLLGGGLVSGDRKSSALLFNSRI
eukprot:1026147-Rhodomonas_salina.2